MSARIRMWEETNEQRTIGTGDGFVLASKGDIVLVVIAKRWNEAMRAALEKLNEPDDEGK